MIKIVKAEEYHIPDICKLWLEFMRYSAAIEPVLTVRDGSSYVFESEYLRPELKNGNSLILVALQEDQVLGYSYSMIAEPGNLNERTKYGIIHDFFVTDSHRRQGIGEKMYHEILDWFKSRDITRVELQVIDDNGPANSFWRQRGYTDFQSTLYRKI